MPWVDQTPGWAPPVIRRLPRFTFAARLPFRLLNRLTDRQGDTTSEYLAFLSPSALKRKEK